MEGKINPRALPDAVIPPGAGVDIEQLGLPVALVVLVLELDEPVVADRAQEALRWLVKVRMVDRLHVRACPAEVSGMLAQAPHDQSSPAPDPP
jgi:hypothetical protein